MGMERSGVMRRIVARTGVTTDDTDYPSGATQAGSIPVPARARGAVTHVLVDLTATGGTPTVRVDIFGYNTESAIWYWLGALNDRANIDAGLSPVDNSSNLRYAEALDHVSAFDRLFPLLTTIAGTSASVDISFCFEALD